MACFEDLSLIYWEKYQVKITLPCKLFIVSKLTASHIRYPPITMGLIFDIQILSTLDSTFIEIT